MSNLLNALSKPRTLVTRARLAAILAAVGLALSGGVPARAQSQWTGGSSGPIYYNGGNVGINTTTPSQLLQVYGGNVRVSGGIVQAVDTSGADGSVANGYMFSLDPYGSGYGPRLQLGDVGTPNLYFEVGAYNNQNNFDSKNRDLQFFAGGGSGSAPTGIILKQATGNVGIGTTNPVHPLQVAGAIGAEEVIVSATGADYVFDPGYRLAPLTEVAAYVKANHHLPEIPSAAEVEAKGVSLGEMQSKLLAKIEELTLHMIQAEKDNQDLREQVRELKEKVGK